MKYLKFKKSEKLDEVSIEKETVEKYLKDENSMVIINGVLTSFFCNSSSFNRITDVEKAKKSLETLLLRLFGTTNMNFDVAVNGTTMLSGEVNENYYVFSLYTISLEYSEME